MGMRAVMAMVMGVVTAMGVVMVMVMAMRISVLEMVILVDSVEVVSMVLEVLTSVAQPRKFSALECFTVTSQLFPDAFFHTI